MILSIIAALVALRSAFLCYITVKNYFTSRRRWQEFLAHMISASMDILIIFVCLLFVFRGF